MKPSPLQKELNRFSFASLQECPDNSARDIAEWVSVTVGAHAARKGYDLSDLLEWAQMSYSGVLTVGIYRKTGDLSPGVDMKEYVKFLTNSYKSQSNSNHTQGE